MHLAVAIILSGLGLATALWSPDSNTTVLPVTVVTVSPLPSMTTYESCWTSSGIPTTKTIITPCSVSSTTTTTSTTTSSFLCPCQWNTTTYSIPTQPGPIMTSTTTTTTSSSMWAWPNTTITTTTTTPYVSPPPPPPPPSSTTSMEPLTTMVTITPTPTYTTVTSFSTLPATTTSQVAISIFTGAAVVKDGKPFFGAGLAIMVAAAII